MPLEGSLEDLSLIDIFQLLSMGDNTGLLTIKNADTGEVGKVYFNKGDPISAMREKDIGKLPEMLVEAHLISPDRVKDAVSYQKELGINIEQALLKLGLISRINLEKFVRNYIEERIYEFFSWHRGEFRFVDTEREEISTIHLQISTENLIMEGSRRIDEWDRILKKFPSSDVVLKLSHVKEEKIDLTSSEWAIISKIDGKKTLKELTEIRGRKDFNTYKTIYGLVSTGLVEFVEKATKEESSKQPAKSKAEIYWEEGVKLAKDGKLESAMKKFLTIIAMDSDRVVDALVGLGNIYSQMGLLDSALSEYKKALEKDPYNFNAYSMIGYIHLKLGHYHDAITNWEKAIIIGKDSPKANELNTKLNILKQFDKLIDDWEKSLREFKDL